jgi:hypothetical protein
MQIASYGVPSQTAAAAAALTAAATTGGQLPHAASQLASHHGGLGQQAGVVPVAGGGYPTGAAATMQQFQAVNGQASIYSCYLNNLGKVVAQAHSHPKGSFFKGAETLLQVLGINFVYRY